MGTIDEDVVFPRAVTLKGDHSVSAESVHVGQRVGVAGMTRAANVRTGKARAGSVRADEVSTRTLMAGDSGKIRVEGTLRVSGSIVYTPPSIDIAASPFDVQEEEPSAIVDPSGADKKDPFHALATQLAPQLAPKKQSSFLEIEEDGAAKAISRAARSLDAAVRADLPHAPWRRVSLDTFESVALAQGWHVSSVGRGGGGAISNEATGLQTVAQNASLLSHCGDGNLFLGGHCRAGGDHELFKRWESLPPHTELRLTARVHFIDSWDGEAAFMSVDGHTVWTSAKAARQRPADAASPHLSVCGDHGVADAVIGKKIDIVVPHRDALASIRFGTYLDEHACDESFGIDDVALYVH